MRTIAIPIVEALVIVLAGALTGRSQTVLPLEQGLPGKQLDRGLSDLGDVDADGYPDFLVGSPGQGSGRGSVAVRSGHSFAAIPFSPGLHLTFGGFPVP